MSQSHKWFTFSIRDLIWLLLVVGVACGWYAQNSSWRQHYEGMQSEFDRIEDELMAEKQKHKTAMREKDFQAKEAAKRADAVLNDRIKLLRDRTVENGDLKRKNERLTEIIAELKKEAEPSPAAGQDNP